MSPDTTPERPKQTKSRVAEMPDLGWWNGSNKALEGWARSSTSVMQGTLGIAQEIATFSQARLQANFDALTAAASCRSPDDLIKLQQTFAENATIDCLNEANKLTAQMLGVFCNVGTYFKEQSAKA